MTILALLVALNAGIAPQHGIRGVSLDMSRQDVVTVLGRPSRVDRGTGELGSWIAYRYGRLTVTFAFGKGVSQVATTSASDRTVRGVGVGSTAHEVATRVHGARCEADHCYVGTWSAGQKITDFLLRDGRVARVVVGRVLD
jgi:hypothetical protein